MNVPTQPSQSSDIVTRLLALNHPDAADGADEIERLRAVLDAIDALPDKCPDEPYDGYDDFGIGKGLGWEQAMKRVKALLHPKEARRG
jgi:hypothetical protein